MNISNKITVKTNGQLALNYIQIKLLTGETIPELISLDENMPLMKGMEFLEYFRILFDNDSTPSTEIVITRSTMERGVIKFKDLDISTFPNNLLTKDKVQNLLTRFAA
ncbi:MAG: hypothetical protein HRT71_19530 [Flavobacteriales bacterium]|nr:hypothetical protein [Flavobacteriales bacterium]